MLLRLLEALVWRGTASGGIGRLRGGGRGLFRGPVVVLVWCGGKARGAFKGQDEGLRDERKAAGEGGGL